MPFLSVRGRTPGERTALLPSLVLLRMCDTCRWVDLRGADPWWSAAVAFSRQERAAVTTLLGGPGVGSLWFSFVTACLVTSPLGSASGAQPSGLWGRDLRAPLHPGTVKGHLPGEVATGHPLRAWGSRPGHAQPELRTPAYCPALLLSCSSSSARCWRGWCQSHGWLQRCG